MATVNKDFKVKNGLIVEGSVGTINNHDILTKKQDDQDYIVNLIGGTATSANTPDTVVKRDGSGNFAAGTITADLTGDVTGTVSSLSNHDTGDLTEGTNLYYTDQRVDDYINASIDTDDISEGSTNLYYTNQRVDDYVNNSMDTDDLSEGSTNLYYTDARARGSVSAGSGLDYNSTTGEFSANLGNGLQFDLNGQIEIDSSVVATDTDVSDAIDAHDISSNVHGITGDVVGTTDSQTISNKTLGSNLDAGTYTVTNLGTPVNSTDAATKGYVDSVAEGLHVHASVAVATSSNVTLAPAPATIDTVTLTIGMRVLVKSQTAAAENGIYSFDGTNLVRAVDHNTAAEIDAGDFVFVVGGATYASTGWVQENPVTTLGTDPISWSQFSGAGEYTAGTGLTLNGTEFSADTTYLATKDYVDGEVDSHAAISSNVHGIIGSVVGTTDTQTLTNKTLGADTVLGANLDAVNTYKITNLADPTSNQDAATKFYVDGEISTLSGTVDSLTTSDIAEGTNLYYTDQRVDDYINASVDTDDVSEGTTNLYFTENRAKDAAGYILENASLTNIQITYDENAHTLSITAENGVADSTTDDLDEGTANLYFTDARAVSALEAVVPNFTEIDINSVATQVAATTSVPTASTVTAYQFAHADYRSAKFLVKAETAAHTEVSEVLVTLDGSNNIAITEYAIVGTNGNLVDVSADIDGSSVRLRVTTVNNSTDVTVVGTLIA
jgi:hypothetical protein